MDEDGIVTVKDLVEFLEKNFKRDDRLLFYDEGGAWVELVDLPKRLVGDVRWMFNYVKDKRQHELADPCCHKDDVERMRAVVADNYKSVDDNAVVIF